MKSRHWPVLALCLPFIGGLTLSATRYLPFLSDDALISLRYAQRLLDGEGLTWTAGQPVEGYSNLLWILLVALPGLFGADLIVVARVLGLAGMAAVMATIASWYAGRLPARTAWFPVVAALLFLVLAAPISVWAIGGLEQPLVAALLAVSVPLVFKCVDHGFVNDRAVLWASLPLALLCLTRPDGPLFTVAAVLAILAAGGRSGFLLRAKRAVRVLLLPGLVFAGQIVFRLTYYGDVVPNTARVKIAASATHRAFGFDYLTSGLSALAPFSWLAVAVLAGLLIHSRSRRRAVYLVAASLLWSTYIVFIGGDVFPAYRHFIPLLVLFAFALAEGASEAATSFARRPAVVYALAAVLVLAAIPYVRGQAEDKWIRRAMTERWEWQGKEVGLLLKTAFGAQQPLVAVTAAGSVPYWSELPALDMMGLNDYFLPRHRPPDFGEGMVGHELGDARYVLEQEPDAIVFDVGSPEPGWRVGKELNGLAAFHDRYVPVTVKTQPVEYTAVVFIDKYSRRIGLRRSADAISIPAYLFVGPEALALIGPDNRLELRLTASHPAVVTVDVDPTSSWSVDPVAGRVEGLEVLVRQDGRSLTVTLQVTGAGPVNVAVIALIGRPGHPAS